MDDLIKELRDTGAMLMTYPPKPDAKLRAATAIETLCIALSDAADALEHANDLLGPNTNQIIGREAAHLRARIALDEADYDWHDWHEIPDTPEQLLLIAKHNAMMRRLYPNLVLIASADQEDVK